jgi:hypothetical protein
MGAPARVRQDRAAITGSPRVGSGKGTARVRPARTDTQPVAPPGAEAIYRKRRADRLRGPRRSESPPPRHGGRPM